MAGTAPGTIHVTDGAEGLTGPHHEALGEGVQVGIIPKGAASLESALHQLQADVRVALLSYSPVAERGMTPGGIRVRNVAQPVLGAQDRVFELEDGPLQLRVEDERTPAGTRWRAT